VNLEFKKISHVVKQGAVLSFSEGYIDTFIDFCICGPQHSFAMLLEAKWSTRAYISEESFGQLNALCNMAFPAPPLSQLIFSIGYR